MLTSGARSGKLEPDDRRGMDIFEWKNAILDAREVADLLGVEESAIPEAGTDPQSVRGGGTASARTNVCSTWRLTPNASARWTACRPRPGTRPTAWSYGRTSVNCNELPSGVRRAIANRSAC